MTAFERRFGGVGRLYGRAALERLRGAHVCVVGLGGVGSWAAEALARSGIGALTLVDLDDVCISNVGRQLHALHGNFGKPKVEAMAERIRAINPECAVHARQTFFLKSNASDILSPGFDAVLDAIDSPSLKASLIANSRARGANVVTVGGAAGRRDPRAIEVLDLAHTSHDRLMFQVRRLLRRHYGWPRGDQPFGVECVLSREPQLFPAANGGVCRDRKDAPDLRLDCNRGLGTASFVTGAFGFVAASRLVESIVADSPRLPDGPGPAESVSGTAANSSEQPQEVALHPLR